MTPYLAFVLITLPGVAILALAAELSDRLGLP